MLQPAAAAGHAASESVELRRGSRHRAMRVRRCPQPGHDAIPRGAHESFHPKMTGNTCRSLPHLSELTADAEAHAAVAVSIQAASVLPRQFPTLRQGTLKCIAAQ